MHLLKRFLKSVARTVNLYFLKPRYISELHLHAIKRHLIITGRTWSGKSVFLQSLLYQLQYLSHKRKQYSIILLDPHGDLAERVFAFRLNDLKPDRLIYIDPVWQKDKIPCINPFRQRVADPVMVDLLAQQRAKTFAELIPETGMSLQMETILKPCLAVLFSHWKCGLSDLQDFMNDQTNQKRIDHWKKAKHLVYRNFFANAFQNKKYGATKLAVFTRLQHLQNNYHFYQTMNWPCHFDWKKEMQEGKIILVNLSKWKLWDDTSKALWKFISATLLSYALQRAYQSEKSRKPTYLIMDEFHNLATGWTSMETLFTEARKYKVHLIVGTQSINQLPVSLKNSVMNNTAVKLVWIAGLEALKAQAGDLGVSFNALRFLAPFHFYLKQDHYPAVKIKSPDFLLQHPKRYFLSKKEQAKLKQQLLCQNSLYRDTKETDLSATWSQNTTESTDIFKPKFKL